MNPGAYHWWRRCSCLKNLEQMLKNPVLIHRSYIWRLLFGDFLGLILITKYVVNCYECINKWSNLKIKTFLNLKKALKNWKFTNFLPNCAEIHSHVNSTCHLSQHTHLGTYPRTTTGTDREPTIFMVRYCCDLLP